jgi:hypothetical protein
VPIPAVGPPLKWLEHETDHSPLSPRSRMVELHLQSPMCLHGTVLT